MLIFVLILFSANINMAFTSKDTQITSKITELDTGISHGLKEPEKGGAKIVIQDIRLFNSLYRKVIKAVLSSKEHELHNKKVQLAEIVVKSHPHFIKLQVDEERLVREGRWGEADLKSLKHLFSEAQELKSKLESFLRKHKRTL
ncbi:uncharacterized protein LOC124362096 [Homalodisca vitripennis]|uniref:uncharacterized protein LOC124362096 n=1 Tax=Homalodisca vitripennis TaxID=197043 RepID=UPI001EE9C32B|nr:uncharacterized protein LOC124362096 [Homalodisca vitripennis]